VEWGAELDPWHGGGGDELSDRPHRGVGQRVGEVHREAAHPFWGRGGGELTSTRLPAVTSIDRRSSSVRCRRGSEDGSNEQKGLFASSMWFGRG
jgi:hypothetical protein